MHTFIYIVWFLLPISFLTLALWAWLERLSKSPKKQNPADFLKQALFLAVCVGLAVLIDTYFLESIAAAIAPDLIPLLLYQILLLPLILLIAAKLFGGSKPIRIEKVKRR